MDLNILLLLLFAPLMAYKIGCRLFFHTGACSARAFRDLYGVLVRAFYYLAPALRNTPV